MPYDKELGAANAGTWQGIFGNAQVDTPPGQSGVDPSGVIRRQTGRQHLSPSWLPDNRRLLPEPDTLFLPLVQSESDVLAQDGRLAHAGVYNAYFLPGAVRAPLVAGRDVQGMAFDQTTVSNGIATFNLHGILPMDQFTIELPLYSIGADYTAQPFTSTAWFLCALSSAGASTPEVQVSRTAAGTVHAGLHFNATASPTETGIVNPSVDLVLAAGDIPANTWVTLALTWDGSQLRLYLGNNQKSATGSATTPPALYPQGSLYYQGGGLFINGGSLGFQTTPNFRVGPPHIRRYQRTPAASLLYKGPTVTVNAGTTQGAFPSDVGGVFAQYPGWQSTGADGASGGGGVTATSIRDQLIAAQTAAGLRLVRIDHVFDKIGITGTYPTYTYNWSNLDSAMDALAAKGCKFHITLGYTPSLLGATQGTPPSDNNAFAQMCADAWAHWVAKGYTVTSLSLWNEPGGPDFWSGTQTQFTTLWGVVRAKLATIAGCPALGTCEDGWSTTGYVKAVIDYAHTNALPLGGIYLHDYAGSLATVRQQVRDVAAYAAAQGVSAPIAITEWNFDNAYMAQYLASTTTLASLAAMRNVYYDEKAAAYDGAYLCELVAGGVARATFTRMGILDALHFPSGAEALEGLFTNDDPPRALPAFQTFSMFWKLGGTRISANSNFPYLRALATSNGGVITVFYSTYRPWKDTDNATLSFEWTGLPVSFTWQHWQMDRRTGADGRLMQVGAGDQRNLPLGASIGMLGAGCIQITPL